MVILHDFKKVRPDFQSLQADLHRQMTEDFQRRYHDQPAKMQTMIKMIQKYACKSEHIESRGHEVKNYQSELFEKTEDASQLQRKIKFYSEKTFEKLKLLFKNVSTPPQVLTHVSCTGYSSPSPTQKLISENKWKETANFHAYHMGCYAAFPAIRMSAGELFRRKEMNEPSQRADIYHSELSSLHFDRDRLNPEQMVVQTLFADGYMKYSLSIPQTSKTELAPLSPGFEILSILEEIVPDSLKMMTWEISEPGFDMTLSRHVPSQIKTHLPGFIERLSSQSPVKPQKEELIFAIHPGGTKIINELKEQLGLTTEQVHHCREVLRTHGNMSSATLPTVWKSLLDDDSVPSGQKILTFAFGPGLTICGALLRKL